MNSSDNIQQLLNAKPGKSGERIYLGIILSLSIHVFILGIVFLLTAAPALEETTEEVEAIEEIELSFEEPETTPVPNENDGMSEAVKNLIANAEGPRVNREVSYAKKSDEEIRQEVENDLKSFEEKTFNEAAGGKPREKAPVPTNPTKTEKQKQTEQNQNNNNSKGESYSGAVSAEFSLQGRNAQKKPTPQYRCKGAGKVTLNIEVAPDGSVLNVALDPSSTMDECLTRESLKYAKAWKFDYNDKAPKKQNGKIIFTFSGQK